jgi:hypothetical protein
MKRIVVVIAAACGGTSAPVAGPTLGDGAPVAPVTACYQGVSSGAGQRVQTVARRTVDRANSQIIEDVARGDAGEVRAFHVVMAVTGDAFTLREAGGAFTGSGTLSGPAWQWTSWVSRTTQLAGGSTVEVESREELTRAGLVAHKDIKKDGKVVASTIDELTAIDCAGWDTARAALAVPVLDDALCERSCRRYATLRFVASAEPELAKLPPDQREAAGKQKAEELRGKLEAGLPSCISQCRSANNPTQTACFARAETIQQLAKCDS